MALVPGEDAPDVPLDPVPVYENTDLNGLADDWESDPRVRRPGLKAGGGVLQWPDPKKNWGDQLCCDQAELRSLDAPTPHLVPHR